MKTVRRGKRPWRTRHWTAGKTPTAETKNPSMKTTSTGRNSGAAHRNDEEEPGVPGKTAANDMFGHSGRVKDGEEMTGFI